MKASLSFESFYGNLLGIHTSAWNKDNDFVKLPIAVQVALEFLFYVSSYKKSLMN